MTSIEVRVGQLRSEIAQVEARYDGLFPPGVFMVLENLRRELIALQQDAARPASL